MDLAVRIAAWRRRHSWSQRKLAQLVGVTPQAVCMWETRSIPPMPHNLAKLVEAFGITHERFYGRVPKPRKAA